MIQVKTINQKGLECIRLENETTGEYVSVAPRYGANVHELVLKKKNSLFPIIDGYREEEQFSDNRWFNSAWMAPFPNRVRDGKYIFEGHSYQLPINFDWENNACHGFVFDKPFRLTHREDGPDRASMTLTYTHDGGREGYPFPFEMHVTYILDQSGGFITRARIHNTGPGSMPVGVGWHPYFTFNKKADELLLQIPASKRIRVDDRLIPTGEIVPYDDFSKLSPIRDTAFDTGFIVTPDPQTGRAATLLRDPEQDVTIRFWQETGENKYPYLQLFIPPSRESVAIEPMSCMTNAFNSGNGLLILNKDERFDAQYGIILL